MKIERTTSHIFTASGLPENGFPGAVIVKDLYGVERGITKRELRSVSLHLDWMEADEDGPAGWYPTWRFYGYPLTAKGERSKRVSGMGPSEFHPRSNWPAIAPIALALWDAALEVIGDTENVINLSIVTDLFSTAKSATV